MSEEREVTTHDATTGETVTRTQVVHVIDTGHEPGEQVQDSETGEIIFPGWRRPLRLIEGGLNGDAK
jgi:hypothetical protein